LAKIREIAEVSSLKVIDAIKNFAYCGYLTSLPGLLFAIFISIFMKTKRAKKAKHHGDEVGVYHHSAYWLFHVHKAWEDE